MIGTSFIDNIDTDICGDFFDHIDELLDFPSEDIDIGGGAINGNCCNGGFQDVVSQPSRETVAGSNSVFSGNGSNGGTSELELPTELSVPYEDIAQLEWLSNFVEDSFSAGSITLDKDDFSDKNKDSHHFHISSPVSVLESSSSSREKIRPVTPVTFVRGKPRSKRPRPASFKPRPVIPFISPTSSTSENWSEFDNFAEFFPSKQEVKLVTKEHKKKKKLSSPISSMEEEQAPTQKLIAIRKCMHCEITKTPQWRAGPMGPKTLCNACGVRYKSGRLFPEYRPAASPTFVTSLHSNSHKKVLEMRTKIVAPTAIIPTEEAFAEKQSSF